MKKRSAATKKSSNNQPDKPLQLYLYLGSVQFLFLITYFLTVLWVSNMDSDTIVGAGLVFGLLFQLLLPIFGIIAIINFIGVPLYILQYKPRGKLLVKSFLAWAISLPLVYLGGQFIGLF